MSIDENVLYEVDKAILDTQVFRNRSEMFEYFSGFLSYFDKSFKNIPVEKAIGKMYEKTHQSGLANPDAKKTHHKQRSASKEEQKSNSARSSMGKVLPNDTHRAREIDYIEKQHLTKEEQEIREGISNFTGGFFK